MIELVVELLLSIEARIWLWAQGQEMVWWWRGWWREIGYLAPHRRIV